MDREGRVFDIIDKESKILEKTLHSLDVGIVAEIVDIIVDTVKSGNNVFVSGLGKCSFVAEKTATTFCSQGIPSFYINCAHAHHGDVGAIRSNDVLILFSKSGDTREILDLAAYNENLLVIGITCDGGKLRYLSDVCIVAPVDSESDHLNLAATASITVMTSISNILGSLASEELGFTKQDFHARHSKGKLGELSK